MTDKIKYFLEAWEMNGVGQTIAKVQDSPGTIVTITVDDLRALLAETSDKQDEIEGLSDGERIAIVQCLEPGLARHILDRFAAPLANPSDKGAEPTLTPRYDEWLYLRTHGQWSNGVPDWARDTFGRMNDFNAATAVIEELAAIAKEKQR